MMLNLIQTTPLIGRARRVSGTSSTTTIRRKLEGGFKPNWSNQERRGHHVSWLSFLCWKYIPFSLGSVPDSEGGAHVVLAAAMQRRKNDAGETRSASRAAFPASSRGTGGSLPVVEHLRRDQPGVGSTGRGADSGPQSGQRLGHRTQPD